jgi:hypothetical protein
MTKFHAILLAAAVALIFTLATAPTKPKPLHPSGDRWPLATHSRIG